MSACPSCGGVVSCTRECRAATHETLGKPVERCPCGNALRPSRGTRRPTFCSRTCPALQAEVKARSQEGGRKAAARFHEPARFGGVR